MKTKTSWFAIILFISVQCLLSDAQATPPLHNDPNFRVGVAAHPGWGNSTHWSGYGSRDTDIERQIHLAAEMGAKVYRIDAPGFTADILERVITLCEKYGMEVMAIVSSRSGAKTVAKRFKGRVKYYQVNNEMNFQAHKEKYSGLQISHFWMSSDTDPLPKGKQYLDVLITDAIQTIKEVRAEDPGAKILINGYWIHYAFLDYVFTRLAIAGVDIDLIGWNWYSHGENNRTAHPSTKDGLNSVAKYLHDTYGKDIFICEFNMWVPNFDRIKNTGPVEQPSGNGNGKIDPFEEENMERVIGPYLVNNIRYLYNNRAQNHIKGIIIYEFLEQPNQPNSFEAKFGITYVKTLDAAQRHYQILGPKPQYYAVQRLLGGSLLPIKRLNSSSTLPGYTIRVSIVDVDPNGNITSSQAGGTATGSGTYKENAVVTLTATAKPGSEFLGWYRGGIRISKNPVYKFTAVEDANNGDRNSTGGKFAY